jgi:hypothetical protein
MFEYCSEFYANETLNKEKFDTDFHRIPISSMKVNGKQIKQESSQEDTTKQKLKEIIFKEINENQKETFITIHNQLIIQLANPFVVDTPDNHILTISSSKHHCDSHIKANKKRDMVLEYKLISDIIDTDILDAKGKCKIIGTMNYTVKVVIDKDGQLTFEPNINIKNMKSPLLKWYITERFKYSKDKIKSIYVTCNKTHEKRHPQHLVFA